MLYLIRYDEYQVTKQAIIAGEDIKDARANLKAKFPAAMKMKTVKFSVAERNRSEAYPEDWAEFCIANVDLVEIASGGVVVLPFQFTWS